MFSEIKPRTWDVNPDGSVKLVPLKLESERQNALELVSDRKVATGIVAGYAGAGSVLSWWWGSSGVLGFMTSAAAWPLVLAWKLAIVMLWPALLVGAAGVGGFFLIRNKIKKN